MKATDLTFGIDVRGDEAFFIERRHFTGDWTIDAEARKVLKGHSAEFFRMIEDGEQVHSHGWIEGGKVIQ
jgi:hypothetical protein